MAKVLISFLGTGRIKNDASKREYEPTKYRIDNKDYECTFVSVALRKHLNIEKMMLVGTAHSMWEDVYREYAGEDDIWLKIGEECSINNHASPLEIPHKEDIESAMGGGSKVVLVKYGFTQEEIKENSEIILGLESSLEKGDELFVDITHSFRSLPLFIMNLLIYLRDVSPKKVKISGIYYGMLEAYKDLHYAPIVNLNEVLNVNSWISGAYSFMEFGNAYKIAELVKSIDGKLSNSLVKFSETKNLNHLSALEQQSVELGCILKNNNGLPPIAQMLIPPVIGDFVKRLSVDINNPYRHSKFQNKLARWQFNNKNYLASYISLTEAIITYLAEQYQERMEVDIDVYDKDERDAIKDKIKGTQICISQQWKELYRKVSFKRNALAHNLKKDPKNPQSGITQSFIDSLKNYLGEYDKLVQNS